MGDPVSERAHYLAVESGGAADLFLIQQGRLESPGFVSVIWRRVPTKAELREPAGMAGGRLRRAITHALASFLVILL